MTLQSNKIKTGSERNEGNCGSLDSICLNDNFLKKNFHRTQIRPCVECLNHCIEALSVNRN